MLVGLLNSKNFLNAARMSSMNGKKNYLEHPEQTLKSVLRKS